MIARGDPPTVLKRLRNYVLGAPVKHGRVTYEFTGNAKRGEFYNYIEYASAKGDLARVVVHRSTGKTWFEIE